MAGLKITDAEECCARIAARVVAEGGDFLSFDEYDEAMRPEQYFAPLHWIAGWGLPRVQKKANDDKLCAFAACEMGLMMQTKGGYVLLKVS